MVAVFPCAAPPPPPWQEGDPWLVVEAAWVQRWLAFVQGDDSARKPGPIQNETLLVRAFGERNEEKTKDGGPKS